MSYQDPGQAWWNAYVVMSPSQVVDRCNVDLVFKQALLSVQALQLYGFANPGNVAGSNQVGGCCLCNSWIGPTKS